MNQDNQVEDPRIARLQEEIADLRLVLGYHLPIARRKESLTKRGQDPERIVKKHIHLLHTYNEIKDGTQKLIYHVSQFACRRS